MTEHHMFCVPAWSDWLIFPVALELEFRGMTRRETTEHFYRPQNTHEHLSKGSLALFLHQHMRIKCSIPHGGSD